MFPKNVQKNIQNMFKKSQQKNVQKIAAYAEPPAAYLGFYSKWFLI